MLKGMCICTSLGIVDYLFLNFDLQTLMTTLIEVHDLQDCSHARTPSLPKVYVSDVNRPVSSIGLVSKRNVAPPTIWFISFVSSSNFFAYPTEFFFAFSMFFIFLEFKVRVFVYLPVINVPVPIRMGQYRYCLQPDVEICPRVSVARTESAPVSGDPCKRRHMIAGAGAT